MGTKRFCASAIGVRERQVNSSKMFNIVLAIVAIVLLGQFLMPVDGVSVKQAQAMTQQGALLLDVREPEEYAAMHAPNAKLIPLSELEARISEIDSYRDKPVVVMCRSGRRSAKAVEELKDAGFTQVSNMKGGITAWEKDGLEVVRK